MALIDNIVAYYKLDESSGNASDATGGGKTLTNNNTVAYAAGKINNGADFSSTNTNKSLRINNDMGIGGGNVSISAWIKRESSDFMFPIQVQDATSHIAYSLSYESGGIKANRNKINTVVNQTTAQAISLSTWAHVVLTYDGSTVSCYVNAGTPQTVASSGNGGSGGSDSFTIGCDVNTGTGADQFFYDGMVDEVGIWSRALSSAEVTELYNGGAGIQYPFTAFNTYPVIHHMQVSGGLM